MSGQDKGLLRLAGRPMIEYVIDCIRPQVDEVLINANRSLDVYANYGWRVIQDPTKDYAGPLAGIAAGIGAASTELVLTVPCDCPCLPADLASRLVKGITEESAMVAVAHDGERMQPVCAMFRKEILPEIHTYLDAGERMLQIWMERQKAILIDFSDRPGAFANINTPQDKLRIEQILTGH